MRLEIAKRIAQAAEADGIPLRLREEYSGRGMYSQTTAGLIGSLSDFVQAVASAAFAMGWEHDDGTYDAMSLELRRLRTDSMGHDTIVY